MEARFAAVFSFVPIFFVGRELLEVVASPPTPKWPR